MVPIPGRKEGKGGCCTVTKNFFLKICELYQKGEHKKLLIILNFKKFQFVQKNRQKTSLGYKFRNGFVQCGAATRWNMVGHTVIRNTLVLVTWGTAHRGLPHIIIWQPLLKYGRNFAIIPGGDCTLLGTYLFLLSLFCRRRFLQLVCIYDRRQTELSIAIRKVKYPQLYKYTKA